MPKPKRKDYARNARKPYGKQSGCTWCGDHLDGVSSYCSDSCLQADMAGIDDLPPVVVVAYSGAQASEEYTARKIDEMNESYNDWKDGRPTP